MSRNCPPGTQWDNLIKSCFRGQTKHRPKPEPEPEPTTEQVRPDVVQLRPTVHTAHTAQITVRTAHTVQVNPVMFLSPALWIFVMLATLGSILALALWFIIYRRQASLGGTSEDVEQQQEPLQKTDPPALIQSLPSETNRPTVMLQRAAEAPSPCSHLHPGAQTCSQWEEGFITYRDPTNHAGTDRGRALPTCGILSEHRIPLPATELGGTALVTTKTM